MPLRDVRQGDALEISAEAHNAWNDAARKAKSLPGQGDDLIRALQKSGSLIRVHNTSGENLDQFAVVGLDDVTIAPDDNAAEFKRRVCIDVVKPTSDHINKFGVITTPIPIDHFGWAIVAGATQCKLIVNHDSEEYAVAKSGEYKLSSSAVGNALIIYKSGTSGTVDAIVVIGVSSPGIFPVKLTTDGGSIVSTTANLTYTVKSMKDVELATAAAPFYRALTSKINTAATRGEAWYEDGTLKFNAFEQFKTGAC